MTESSWWIDDILEPLTPSEKKVMVSVFAKIVLDKIYCMGYTGTVESIHTCTTVSIRRMFGFWRAGEYWRALQHAHRLHAWACHQSHIAEQALPCPDLEVCQCNSRDYFVSVAADVAGYFCSTPLSRSAKQHDRKGYHHGTVRLAKAEAQHS